jgi:mannose/fructose/N-acetylgalactosamine-specific phosphotransferase system component IID
VKPGALDRAAVVASFLRCFLIQGSWNYHTMLGSGFAFAMLPGLKRIFADDPEGLEASVERHLEHFNAHPYLSGMAVGAALRLEAEGETELVRRFKMAIRGPLGGLGDALVWASWLPAVSLVALALAWLGAPAWVVVLGFLTLYNAGHLALRVWGFRAGLREGRGVGAVLGRARFPSVIEWVRDAAVLLLGILAGATLAAPGGLWEAGPVWTLLAGASFLAGLRVGQRAWRPAAGLVVVAVALLTAWGGFGP